MAQKIIIANPNLGGLADSEYLGSENSLAAAVGLDLHSKPGLIRVNQRLVRDDGGVVTVRVNAIVSCSNGLTYLFGDSGKIYQRTAGGTTTLARTAAPVAGSANIVGAREHNGYVYYATEKRLGRWKISDGVGTADDNWGTFTNGQATWHPMFELNLILYIGDKNYVAQVEDQSGTHIFTAKALDVKDPTIVKSLGRVAYELLLGTYVGANVTLDEIVRWNTWSVSFSSSDEVPEVGINAFLPTDNFVLVQCGTQGNLYAYSSDVLQLVKKIPGDYSAGGQAFVNPYATALYRGLPMFGVSNNGIAAAPVGVYSYGSINPGYPKILNLEYALSTGNLTTAEITAMTFIRDDNGDNILVAWKDGSNYGVDRVDLANKYATASLDSRVVAMNRAILKQVVQIEVPYKNLPSGASIEVWCSKNHGAFSQVSAITDVDRKMIATDVRVENAAVFQVRVKLIPNGNNAPEVEQVIITI